MIYVDVAEVGEEGGGYGQAVKGFANQDTVGGWHVQLW